MALMQEVALQKTLTYLLIVLEGKVKPGEEIDKMIIDDLANTIVIKTLTKSLGVKYTPRYCSVREIRGSAYLIDTFKPTEDEVRLIQELEVK